MEVKLCRRCKRLFQPMADEVMCYDCRVESEKEFKAVREYLRDNPGAGVKEVSNECEVSERQIIEWVREERLMFSGDSTGIICEKCGRPIPTGRFCDKCKTELTNELKEVTYVAPVVKQEDAPRSRERMRFLG